MPPFQSGLKRILPSLRRISRVSRGMLCKPIEPADIKARFHIIETSRIQIYNVDEIGLTDEEDKNVLKTALAAASSLETFLVTADYCFLTGLDRAGLSRKYPSESRRLKIVPPNDSDLIAFLNARI